MRFSKTKNYTFYVKNRKQTTLRIILIKYLENLKALVIIRIGISLNS